MNSFLPPCTGWVRGWCVVQVSSRLTTTLIVCILILLEAAAASLSIADQTAANLLKQARDEKNPAKRIELLDQALKDSSLKGDTLAALFFERAMAYKTMNDCFRAIEDLDASLAHSRVKPLRFRLKRPIASF